MLFDSRGNPVQIGQELGHGGEGAVYETPGRPGSVAKLYFSPPDVRKQAKLTYMAQMADASLLTHAAWPEDTLHAEEGGPAVGFLMPKMTGKEPIHTVYGPKHRRQKMPDVGWDFLLNVARNTAAAFTTLHAHGHVVGDVNQGNVLVGRDSQVVLIDSDSYQIRAKDTVHLCDVGLAQFTPPELQGISSFSEVARTANHDNFGLALLVFYVLFGGRHPYSGVPLRRRAEEGISTGIKAFRYAYARDAQSRGIAPPPGAPSISLAPDALQALFHQAFTERGASCGRPTASQWFEVLDARRSHLAKCGVSIAHVFPSHLSDCPWCALARQGFVYFADWGGSCAQTASGFVLAHAWERIMAVPQPSALAIPDPRDFSPVGRPASRAAAKQGRRLAGDLTIAVCVAMCFVFPKAWLVWAFAAWLAFACRTPAESAERVAERAARRQAEELAERSYSELVERLKQQAGPEGFLAKRRSLGKLKTEYERLARDETKELDQLEQTAHECQKQKFLDSFFIEAAEIPGVGPCRKAALQSFGVETAADVSRSAVMQVAGFSPSLTRAVVDWRTRCEQRFIINPRATGADDDKAIVRARYAARRIAIEAMLASGAAELASFARASAPLGNQLREQVENAARALAKARADLEAR